MEGFKASRGGGISSVIRATATMQLVGASTIANYDKCDSEEDSLEEFAETDDECDHLPSEEMDDEPISNGHNDKTQEIAPMDRDVHTFFEQFLPNSSAGSGKALQPFAVLQSRYNAQQHQLNKQAQHKSVKPWFRDQSRGKDGDSWKASEIIIPSDIATMWGVKSVHSSGQFRLTRSEMETLKVGNDIILDLCGEYRVFPSNVIRFKSKKGAQKSAALNLLLTMDLGDLPTVSDGLEENGQSAPNEVREDDGMSMPMSMPKERFQLENIEYYGAVKSPEGEFLSHCNSCMVQCIVSVKDTECHDLNRAALEVTSDFFQNEVDSLNAASEKLGPKLMDLGATANDVNNVVSSMKESKPNIAYEMALPKWASAKIHSKVYLYELEFRVCKEGSDECTPLSEAVGLDANAATRIGVLCGCDLFEGQKQFEKQLCADFMMASSVCTASSSVNVRVKMCRRAEATVSELLQQLEGASPKIDIEDGEDPITLAKCFNIVLFDYGKTYGMGPKPVLGELLKRLDDDKAKPDDRRTCLFLPLHVSTSNLEINWRLVWDVVHHKTTRVLSHSGARIPLPTLFLKQITLGLSLVASVACAISTLLSVARCYTDWNAYSLQRNDWIVIPLLATSFAFGILTVIIASKTIPMSLLRNHFLTQPIGFGGRMFIAKNEGATSIISLTPVLWHILKMIWHEVHTGFCISNAKYYKHIWQRHIGHPMEPLIPALFLKGFSYAHHELSLFHQLYGEKFSVPVTKPSPGNSISNLLADLGLLVPDLTQMLPMPRDMLYLCHYASIFMPKFERSHNLGRIESRLREVQHNAGILLHYKTFPSDNILHFVDKATSICNNSSTEAPVFREHERLEALGDSVLLYFIILNEFAKQSSTNTEHVLSKFEEVISLQGSNKLLFKAAMQIGLHRSVHVGNLSSINLWRSRCKTTTKVALSRKQMGDIVESILGATYLIDPSGCMAVGFLNEIGSCLPNVENDDFDLTTNWFAGKGTCLTKGYPFIDHSEWTVQLSEIEGILQHKHHILSTLQRMAADFCQLLTKEKNCQDRMEMLKLDPMASLLLHCALFDDSLESDPETLGLESFASLRDKLFNVGEAALQLSIVSDIYRLYPTSTSGDIHLMKTVSLSKDSLAYIFVKNRFHECLFDINADATIVIQGFVKESDLLGAKKWKKHGGWIIPGGPLEFRRRIQQYYGDDSWPEMACPRYMGLAAGRFWGHKHKEKASDDLQFSMKCIIGALVLTFGVKDAWDNMLRPLFLELMLLSPEELRTSYEDDSDLVSNYKKGKR